MSIFSRGMGSIELPVAGTSIFEALPNGIRGPEPTLSPVGNGVDPTAKIEAFKKVEDWVMKNQTTVLILVGAVVVMVMMRR